MKRSCAILMPLLLVAQTGCVPLFYAYPSFSYVPTLNIGKPHDNTFVFRVDITDDTGEAPHYRLRALRITQAGHITGQVKAAIDDGCYWNCIAFSYIRHVSHTLCLRLYRPGYDLFEVHAWQTDQPPEWQKAPTVAAREKAVDDLLGLARGGDPLAGGDKQFGHLDPGSVSAEHREALVFAAKEYDRVAAAMDISGDDNGDGSARCRAKAKALRELAGR
jgi:hypothetical protein